MLKILPIFSLLLVMVTCQNHSLVVRYDDYQVYRVTPHTMDQLKSLQEFYLNNDHLDFWSPPSVKGNPVDVMIPPDFNNNFQNFIKSQNLDAEVWIKNLQEIIEEGKPYSGKSRIFDWTDYYTLETIYSWMDSLTKKYSGFVTIVVGGKTYEGREIRGVKVSFGPGKRGVFLEGGIHAREWASPTTVTYILNEILTSNNPSIRTLAEAYDWYVFPIFNPDGYVYTHTTDRMWRKTRKPYGQCIGADPNRNWNYHWNHGGTSPNPCAQTFPGNSAFSEIETKTLSQYISTIAKNLDAYISFHTFGQMLMYPFGHQGLEKPENYKELHSIGKAAIDKLTVRYGTKYTVGSIPEEVGVASGASLDWVRGIHRQIRLAYAFELRDTGRCGFDLPKNQIIPTAEETFDAVVTLLQKIQ